MRARESFEALRRKKDGWFSLRTRLVLMVALEIIVVFWISFSISAIAEKLIPKWNGLPFMLELNIVSLIIAIIATRILSKIVFDPISQIREAMKKVADGDFSVRLETNSSSVEIQSVFAGFNMMTQELSATEIIQTDFVTNVSHEFKTPINAIEGYAMLLQNCENLNGEQQEYVEKIMFNTKRLSSLVGNILLLSKIESQSIRTNQTQFRLDEQIRQSIVVLEPEWDAKSIEFDVELDSVEYVGSESLLHHVWDNLIGNAIKFSNDGGLVKLRLYKQDEKIVFTVEDRGQGLSDETKKHMFDKFYQADSSHEQKGNGLGLALVKRILSIAGGDVEAENNVGTSGCIFRVTLNDK